MGKERTELGEKEQSKVLRDDRKEKGGHLEIGKWHPFLLSEGGGVHCIVPTVTNRCQL